MGYDISNYEEVYPPYGTLADMEQLIRECHSRGLRIMLDLVINHTSNMHQWFRESRSAKDSPKRDWYIWRPAKYDDQGNRHPPNNWRSIFGNNSAWEWDPATEEYYLHLFATEQPDLNWENPHHAQGDLRQRDGVLAGTWHRWLPHRRRQYVQQAIRLPRCAGPRRCYPLPGSW